MNRGLYDFTVPPDTPKEAHTTHYYFPHKKQTSMGIQMRGPAYQNPPCMAVHYDKDGILLFTRFIFKDGSYKDDHESQG